MRGALAMAVPLVVSMLLHYPGGTWTAIAALNGIIADKGGSYRARAATVAIATCAAAVVAALGTLVHDWHPLLVAPLVFLVALVTGLARALGAPGAAGVQVLVTFLVALALPVVDPAGAAALERGGLILVGGAWAMLLVLTLWPLRPYRPARLAVARCYRELAAFVEEVDRRIAARAPLTAGLLAERAAAMRHAVEDAAAVLASTRRGNFAETGRGARLVQLHGIADRIFVHAVAVAETTDAVDPARRDPAVQVLLPALLGDVAATLRALADATEAERSGAPHPVSWSGAPLRVHGRAGGDDGSAVDEDEIGVAHVAVLLDRMAQLAAGASSAAAGLESGRYGVAVPAELPGATRGPLATAASKVRAVLTPGSLILRHALRVALVTTLAVVLTGLLGIPYGYWISITVVVLLQPYTGMTTRRSVQRVAGAVIGGAIAAGLGALLREPAAIVALVVVFVALSQAIFPVSYVVFTAFVTPAFVLLVELQTGDWGLAWVRVLNTVAGGALAFGAARLLWPLPEWNRLPVHMAAALRAVEAYLRVVADVIANPAEGEAEVRPLTGRRREIELAVINAEESFQRLLGENGGTPARLEAGMGILVSIRNVANAVAALALARHAPEPRRAGEVAVVAGVVEAALADMAGAILEARPPLPLPEPPALPEPSVAPLMRTALTRLQRQAEALHHAVTRWTAPEASTGRRPTASATPAAPSRLRALG